MPAELARLAGTPGSLLRTFLKASRCFGIERMIWFLGAGQVAHEQAHAQALHGFGVSEQGFVFSHGKSQAIDAGINMDGAGKFPAIDPAEGRPFARLFGGDQGGQEIVLGIEFGLAGEQAIEHIDRGFGKHAAQFFAFLGTGDKEAAAARFPQGAAHGLNAQAIGIAFDGGATFG